VAKRLARIKLMVGLHVSLRAGFFTANQSSINADGRLTPVTRMPGSAVLKANYSMELNLPVMLMEY